MQITEVLARNAREWPNDVALVEINPQELENRHTTWREYSLIESSPIEAFRSEITWAEFEEKANRFANLLLSRGYKKGDKVAILLMNCLEWLPIYFGALRVPPALIRRWRKVFPHHAYDTNYGLSESTGPGAVHLGVENIDHVGAIGVAGYGWQTKIIRPDGSEVAPGEVGELALKGPGVMKCYYKNPAATAEILSDDGWLRTGDMAEVRDGFIYLVDRAKDVIITGGENLYPVQIEDFLRAHPAIKDVAVIGLADARLGEIAAAIIEVKAGMSLTEDEVNRFCLDLPRYKRPRRIIFAPVPRNPTGKIEKPKLRRMYGAASLVAQQNGL